jgi:hypothetical protein
MYGCLIAPIHAAFLTYFALAFDTVRDQTYVTYNYTVLSNLVLFIFPFVPIGYPRNGVLKYPVT